MIRRPARRLASLLLGLLPDQGQGLRRWLQDRRAARRARLIARRASASGWRLPDPDRVLLVSPSRVTGHTRLQPPGQPARELRNAVFGQEVLPGTVIGGDWDHDAPAFESLAAYRSIEERVRRQVPWRDTEYFAESMRDIESGRPLWNCRNADQLEARLHYIDDVIASVRRHGLLRQTEVSAAQDPTRRWSDEAEINIGRDGALLFQDGRHRMAIAKVLDIPRIPVKVKVRHIEWQRLRERILDLRQPTPAGPRLPWPLPHPDLDDIECDPVAVAACAALGQLELPVSTAGLVDLEARLGAAADILCGQGRRVDAIEPDPVLLAIGRRLVPQARWQSAATDLDGRAWIALGAGPLQARAAEAVHQLSSAVARSLQSRVPWALSWPDAMPAPTATTTRRQSLGSGWSLWISPDWP